jgi:hypothetical protein
MWRITCIRRCGTNLLDMSTQLLPLRTGTPALSRSRQPMITSQWTIEMAVSVNTNIRRIFAAMTLPEYQEAWLRMPGHDFTCYVSASRSNECFRIDRSSINGTDVSIFGCYRVFRRNKLHFTWRKIGFSNSNESLVQVRLHGDFGRSTIRIRHSGLLSTTEYLWHHEMWDVSLSNLAALF